jgi:DUF1365 family protein
MSAPLRSTLLVGKVRHHRHRPTSYTLEHDVWYFGLRLDELDRVFSLTRLLGRNRRSVVTLRDGDFLPSPAVDLPSDFAAHLRAEGIDPSDLQVELVANLRIFGYVFNPASFYLCRSASGTLRAVVVEVHNTYGERHLYTLRPASGADGGFAASMAKQFFVSPFIGVDGRYRVTVRERGRALRIGISLREADDPLLATSLVLERRPLTRSQLVRLLVRHPLATQKTIVLIHWHALRLWLRGVPFHSYRPRQRVAEKAP